MDIKDPGQDASAEPTPATGRELSPAQLEQRRAAARKSTGPRTPEGKAVSRFNALTHGLFASDAVSATLDGRRRAAEFRTLLDSLLEDLAPTGAIERLLVEEIAVCCWRLRRVLRSECREAWIAEEAERENELPEEFAQAAKLLGQEKKLEAMAERHVQVQRGRLDAMLLPPQEAVDAILRFEGHVKSHLHRALKTLVALQERRRAQEERNRRQNSKIGADAKRSEP